MTRPVNVVGALIEGAIPLSRCIARFLLECESVLGTENLNPDLASETDLLAQVGEKWRSSPDGSQALADSTSFVRWNDGDEGRWDRKEFERRLARIVLHAWSQRATRTGRRPDVLHLTSVLLANPAFPNTFKIARFAVILALRSLYQIRNDSDQIESLRVVYRRLATRFSDQQRRRVLKNARGPEAFLIDLLCMGRSVYRSVSGANLNEYYQGFSRWPLGVDPKVGTRHFSDGKNQPEIHGSVPDFSSLLNLAFNQPTGVPGLDEVTGGLMANVSNRTSLGSGGLISLVAGPPGSGKTTLCMSISSRMAELGSQVAYISTEELQRGLIAKRISVVDVDHLADCFWPDGKIVSLEHTFNFYEGRSFVSLRQVENKIVHDVGAPRPDHSQPGHVYLTFPHVIVIDSISALLNEEEEVPKESESNGKQVESISTDRKRSLAETLNALREMGVCVFLVGEKEHLGDQRLAYLVDNVFTLDFEEEDSRRHPIRVLSVEKTRLQISYRGRHVFHLSRFSGPSVSPSLHSILRMVGRSSVGERQERRAVLWARMPAQPFLPGLLAETTGEEREIMSVRAGGHTLVYGWGSTGKAKVALAMAFEPKHPVSPSAEWIRYLSARSQSRSDEVPITDFERQSLARSRVLIVSFLYDHFYYEETVRTVVSQRFGALSAGQTMRDKFRSLDLYPGYLDPETLVGRVRQALQSGRLEGRPYTAVVIDGIHNMLLQFPLLTRERLWWPTLYRVLSSEGCDAISTFTFFKTATAEAETAIAAPREEVSMVPDEAQRMFYHLLVGSCDYSFLIRRISVGGPDGRGMLVVRTSTLPGAGRERDRLLWDPVRMRFRAEDGR